MKSGFNNLSIRIKVVLLIAFISTIVLIISASLFFLYDNTEFKSKTLRDLSILADVIGNNNTAAIAFNDKRAAEESLKSLMAEKQIKHAVIFTKDGKKLAEYYNMPSDKKNQSSGDISLSTIELKNLPKEGYRFNKSSLIIYKDIVFDKENIGKVYLFSTLEEYNKRFNKFISFLLLLLFYSILGIMVFSLLLQGFISKPIIRLSKLIDEVTDKRDYSLRISKTSNDEVGKLCDGFNHMLTEVESQNFALEIAKSNAEKSDSLKSIFLSNMSHEIRTPLNAIIGFTDLILNKNLNDKDKLDYILYINSSSKILLQLINDIIDLAKIESGQLKINIAEIPVNFILNEIYSSISKEIKLKGKDKIELKVIAENKNLIINADQLRLKQIFNNLINNAIKFTNEGYIEFGYKKIISEMNSEILNKLQISNFDSCILFYVKDSGIGISKDKVNIIFERFRQIKGSEINSGGSGLGLSICKNLVEQMGGKIYAESEPGKGSTFYFTLPV